MKNQREKDLISVARALFNLVKNEDDIKRLDGYKKLLGEAASVFDEYDIKVGKMHPDLGTELFEYYLFKIDGDKSAAESYKKVPEDIIKSLEKEYSVH